MRKEDTPVTYTFIGNGKWSDTSNWLNKQKPPLVLDSGSQVIINPADSGECILDTLQLIMTGGKLIIEPGKKFRALDDLKVVSKLSKPLRGKIILPEGTSINLNNCRVVTLLDESTIRNSSFLIDTVENNLSPVFITDQNDNPIMMKYVYAGQKDNDFTSQSTALGLFMSLPSVQSLTDSAKLALLPKITSTPEFNSLVNEVTKELKSGGSFADGQDSTLNAALFNMLDKASSLKVLDLFDNPVSIYSAGNQLSLVNNGTANIYGVGLYKDGQLLGSVQNIGGYDYLPTSLGDIAKHVYAVVTHSITDEPKSLDYTLTLDGQYTLKIRSGGIAGDNSAEATQAIWNDIVKGAMNLIALYVPDIKTGQCKLAIIGKLFSYISNTYSISQLETSSPTVLAQFMLNSASYLFSSASDLIKGCGSQEIQNKYLNGIGKFFYYINIVGAVNAAVNSSIIGYQLQNAKGILDTCVKVKNGKISSCITIPTLTTSPVTSITSSTAVCGGTILNDGDASVMSRGVCWSTTANPKITDTKTSDGTGIGTFESHLTNLQESTTYYARAYATNSTGTGYGHEITFKTAASASLDNSVWTGYYTETNDGWPAGTQFYVKLILHVTGNTITGDWYNAIPVTNSNPSSYTGIIWTYFGNLDLNKSEINWTGSNISVGTFTFDAPWVISGTSLTGKSTLHYSNPNDVVATYFLKRQPK